MRHLRHIALSAEALEAAGIPFVTDPATGRFYPIPAGGADDDTGTDDAADDDQDDDQDDGTGTDDAGDDDQDDDQDDGLGEKGKKALDRMKAKERATRRELRAYKNLGLTPEQIAQLAEKNNGTGDGDEPDADAIREQVRTEVQAEVMRDRALDKVETKAAKKFANPEIARQLLAERADEFVDGDQIDVDEINEALDELLEQEPYLAAQSGKWKGGGDGGARPSKPSRPKSIAEAIATRQKA